MYQKKTKKLIKRGSSITRLREARRQQRRLKMKPEPKGVQSPRARESPGAGGAGSAGDAGGADQKAVQSRLLLQLAWKTVALMHNNRVIQQKIVALQKETSDFLASVVNYPESKYYHEKFCLYALALKSQSQSLRQQTIKTKALTNDMLLTQVQCANE